MMRHIPSRDAKHNEDRHVKQDRTFCWVVRIIEDLTESSQPGTDSDRSHRKYREEPRRVAAADLWRTLLHWDYQEIMVFLPEPRFLLGYRSKLARYSDQKSDQNHS